MQTFEQCVKSINVDERLFGEYGLLYRLLNVENTLGDKRRIIKCFSFLEKTAPIIQVKTNGENEHFASDSVLNNELYSFIAEKIAVQNILPRIKLRFDGTADDLKNFMRSIATVFDFNRTIGDYIAAFFEEKYGNVQINYRSSREARFIVASKFLHGCFPECFIPFDIKLYGKSKRLFHDDECIIRDCVLSKEIKQTLFDEKTHVYDCFDEVFLAEANHPEKKRYLYFCAKVYALCGYLKENITDIEYNPITLALLIFKSVVTTKWRVPLDKGKRIFANVKESVSKDEPSVLCAVSEDGTHVFRYELKGQTSEYWRLVLGADPKQYATFDIPAAKALAAFERFCKDECGLSSREDEIIFTDDCEWRPDEIKNFVGFLGSFLLCVDWANVCYLKDCYKSDTAYLDNLVSYSEFKEACNIGLSEPNATKHLYDEYIRLIAPDKYDKTALEQMERYVKSHLDAFYKRENSNTERQVIPNICPKICVNDFERFTSLMDYVIDDYKTRDAENKDFVLWNLLSVISAFVSCDYLPSDSDENANLLSRAAIYRCLTSENLKTIKEIFEKYGILD